MSGNAGADVVGSPEWREAETAELSPEAADKFLSQHAEVIARWELNWRWKRAAVLPMGLNGKGGGPIRGGW